MSKMVDFPAERFFGRRIESAFRYNSHLSAQGNTLFLLRCIKNLFPNELIPLLRLFA